MDGEIKLVGEVETLEMPENLRVGLLVSEHRKKCLPHGCPFDYHGFAFGQSPFHVPDVLAKALGESAVRGHYSDAQGIPELREAVAGFYERHFGLDPDPDLITVGQGTKALIYTMFHLVEGDVIIPSPSWIGYAPQVNLLSKELHVLRTDPADGYKVIAEKLDGFLESLDERQHILVLNNPHNPTGLVYTRDELLGIAEVCRKHGTLVLADEIYALTTFDFESFTSMAAVYPEGTFLTGGLSKDRSAGGYRLGVCLLPREASGKLRRGFEKVAATVYTNVSTPTQYAAVSVFEPSAEIDEYFRVTREVNRMMVLHFREAFAAIEGLEVSEPKGGFYFFADFNGFSEKLVSKGVKTSNDLSSSLLSHPHHVAVVTGDACMLAPDDFGARIALVDYDGKAAFEDYRKRAPAGPDEEARFVERNAPRMVKGVEALRVYMDELQAG
ncbi:MAG: pyridoxal phosphate-dependent aminotransferase [Planctomycetota bacterium]